MEDCFLILEQNILHQFVFIARIWNHIRILIQRVKCLGLPTLYHHLVHFTRIGQVVEVCLTVKNWWEENLLTNYPFYQWFDGKALNNYRKQYYAVSDSQDGELVFNVRK